MNQYTCVCACMLKWLTPACQKTADSRPVEAFGTVGAWFCFASCTVNGFDYLRASQ